MSETFTDHRGWRFFAPYYCFRCGVQVDERQFRFSRTCGPCDLSESRTAILPDCRGLAFAGKRERLATNDRADLIPPQFRFIDVPSVEAMELIRNGAPFTRRVPEFETHFPLVPPRKLHPDVVENLRRKLPPRPNTPPSILYRAPCRRCGRIGPHTCPQPPRRPDIRAAL